MSDPSHEKQPDDSMLSIAADFARVLWSPTAVFRRRRATSAGQVLFVFAALIALLSIPFLLGFAVPHSDKDGLRVKVMLTIVILGALAAALLFVTGALVEAVGVWIGAKALGQRLPIHRAVVVEALSAIVMILFLIPAAAAFVAVGPPLESVLSGEDPAWLEIVSLNLGPLAPESRPVLVLILSSLGIPAFWIAALHATGAREMSGVPREIKFAAPVFWAASVLVSLPIALLMGPIERSVEEGERAAAKAATQSADTTRAPAGAP
jgi:hypothetical protein